MNAIYLSGKITGLTELQYTKNFSEWNAYWKSHNYTVYNALEFTKPEYEKLKKLKKSNSEIWGSLMKVCIRELLKVDKIFMMSGWKGSKGARLEHKIAQELGYMIIYEEDLYE